MGSQVRRRPLTAFSKPQKPVKNKDYLSFIHELPCVVTGKGGVEAAHLSTANPLYGHLGRGKSQKASDRWVLPLSQAEHRRQHDMNEEEYWKSVAINPWALACIIYGIWSEHGENGVEIAIRAIRETKESA